VCRRLRTVIVLVRSGDGRIAGLNATDGKRVWVYERSTPALVVRSHAGSRFSARRVAGFAGGRLAALSVKDGEVLWETSVSQPRRQYRAGAHQRHHRQPGGGR